MICWFLLPYIEYDQAWGTKVIFLSPSIANDARSTNCSCQVIHYKLVYLLSISLMLPTYFKVKTPFLPTRSYTLWGFPRPESDDVLREMLPEKVIRIFCVFLELFDQSRSPKSFILQSGPRKADEV